MAARLLRKPQQTGCTDGVLEALTSHDESRRRGALAHLAREGAARSPDYAGLVVQIYSTDLRVPIQAGALRALGAMGDVGASHLPLIVRKLDSKEAEVKLAALQALASLGSRAAGACLQVQRLADDPDAGVAAAAVTCLGHLEAGERIADVLVAKMQDAHAVVRAAAVKSLCLQRCQAEAVRGAFDDSDPTVRMAALNGGVNFRDTFVPAATKLLGDEDCRVRFAAADFFIALGNEGASFEVSPIGEMLASTLPGVRAVAAVALGAAGERGAGKIPGLEQMLEDPDEDTSYLVWVVAGLQPKAPAQMRKPACAAAFALGRMGEKAGGGSAKVAQHLRSDDWELRWACLECLAGLGASGTQHVEEVCGMLKDPYPLVVAKACEVLGKMHDAAGVVSDTVAAEVAELMQDQHAAIRAAATEAVGRMPAQAREDFGTFVHHLEDAAWTVRRAAVFAISRSGPVGQMYASRFCRMMWDTSVGVRVAAIEALGEMGLRGALFIHEVESMTLEPVPSVSSAAAAAVKKLREAIAVDKEDRLIAATDEAAQAFEEEVDPVVAVTDPQKEDDATDAQAETLEVPVALPAPVAPAGLPPLPIALLFPGQGSQYVKMLSEAQKLPAVQSMLTKATEILGYDLLDLCLNGPEEKLAQTKYCQPALFVGGLAGVEMLRQERPEAVDRCQAVAGLSLGEYTALTFAGVFDFETGLRIVKLRGEAMESAAQASEQGMVSLAGLDQDTVEKLCAEAAQGDICRIANFLFPKGFSVAGSKAAVERLKPLAEAKGCLQAKSVKTAGAFHTDFMKPAGEKLLAALQEASEKLRPPKCDVYMNVTGARLERGSDPAVVVEMLSTQLTNSVMWEHSMRAMIADQVTEFYECGPMKQLKAMMKRIDPTAGKATINIAV